MVEPEHVTSHRGKNLMIVDTQSAMEVTPKSKRVQGPKGFPPNNPNIEIQWNGRFEDPMKELLLRASLPIVSLQAHIVTIINLYDCLVD